MTGYARSLPHLGFDPAPGDIGLTRHLARRHYQVAQEARQVLAMVERPDLEALQGRAADAMRALQATFPPALRNTASAADTLHAATSSWANQLTGFQAEADALERQAASASAHQQALQAKQAALPPGSAVLTADMESASAAMSGIQNQAPQGHVRPDHPAITMNEPRPPAYQEAHSALNWPLLGYGLFAPAAAAIACLILGVVLRQPWFFVIMAGLLVPVMIWITLVYRNWPTGIRFDASAISIGAVGSARAARRTPTVNHQSRGLFTCPWPAVEDIRVVTDRAELRRMKNSPRFYTFTNRWGGKAGMSHCNIGVLASPFMRAALVIDVDALAVTAPQIRPSRYYNNFKNGYFSRQIQPRLSPTWVVPTRHPEALSRALQVVPGHQGPVRSE